MKLKKRIFFGSVGLLSLAFIYYKCSYNVPISQRLNSAPLWKDSLKIISDSKINLPLDSLTAPQSIIYYQLVTDKLHHSRFLTFLNVANNQIYYYNLETRSLKRIVRLNDYGFSNRDKVQGYYIINDDSVLVYSYGTAKLSLLSLGRGLLLSKRLYNLYDSDNLDFYPYVSARTPIQYNDAQKTFYLSGFLSDEGGSLDRDKDRKVLYEGNFQSGQFKPEITYPAFYWGINWGGGGGFRQSFMALNNKSDVVVSFMADHDLWLYKSSDGSKKSYYAGSKYIQAIRSLNIRPFYYRLIPEYDIYRYYLTTPSYACLIYDKYRDLYYRVAELPISGNIDFKKSLHKTKSIIILDKNFRKVGETMVTDPSIETNQFFVTEDGLYFKKNDPNNDVLTFEQFITRPR